MMEVRPWREAGEAAPTLRAKLEELGARHWLELAGVRLAMTDPPWIAIGEEWRRAPLAGEELAAALRASHVELEAASSGSTSAALRDELLELYEYATVAKVTQTAQELEHLTEDQPGPEVIHSGTIGEVGLAAWRAPSFEDGELVFFANQERKDGADFVRVTIDLKARSIAVERIDGGWFEIAADLSFGRVD
jgi:hypothetical protein